MRCLWLDLIKGDGSFWRFRFSEGGWYNTLDFKDTNVADDKTDLDV
jgi:hypothetical protein